eukprot:scaffold75866_cov63-Phaeocystis_antarctica.AAC.2
MAAAMMSPEPWRSWSATESISSCVCPPWSPSLTSNGALARTAPWEEPEEEPVEPDLSSGLPPTGADVPPMPPPPSLDAEPARLGLGLVSRLGLVSDPLGDGGPGPLGDGGPSRDCPAQPAGYHPPIEVHAGVGVGVERGVVEAVARGVDRGLLAQLVEQQHLRLPRGEEVLLHVDGEQGPRRDLEAQSVQRGAPIRLCTRLHDEP